MSYTPSTVFYYYRLSTMDSRYDLFTWTSTILVLLSVYIHQTDQSTTATGNTATTPSLVSNIGNNTSQNEPNTTTPIPPVTEGSNSSDYIKYCPSKVECSKLGGECINCDFDSSCIYGRNVSVSCSPKDQIICEGEQNFTRIYNCRYCYQTPLSHHKCTNNTECKSGRTYQANCTVKDNVLCMGRRQFYKIKKCNFTTGKRWSTAFILSITLGGFGVDRFYLGLWREGIGKLFSFGGLGVWTLVDVILIGSGYITPADGSLYIY